MRKIPKMKLKPPEEIGSDGEMFLQMQYMAQRAVEVVHARILKVGASAELLKQFEEVVKVREAMEALMMPAQTFMDDANMGKVPPQIFFEYLMGAEADDAVLKVADVLNPLLDTIIAEDEAQ